MLGEASKRIQNAWNHAKILLAWVLETHRCYFCGGALNREYAVEGEVSERWLKTGADWWELPSRVTLHHLDHDRTNNDTSNLVFCHTYCHRWYHMKIGHAQGKYKKR